MASVNKAIIVGNLGRDPEVRYSPEGTAICSVSIATTATWKDRASGERREDVEWHRVVFFNRLAEIAGEYLKKGRSVYIEGRLKTRKWQDKETGQDRYTTEIVADQLQMLGGRDGAGATRQPDQQQPAQRPQQSQQETSGGGFSDFDDDIPFAPLGHGITWTCL